MVAIEELTYAVEEWSDDGNRLIEVLSRSSNQTIAVTAFKAIRTSRPTKRIRLRHVRVGLNDPSLNNPEPSEPGVSVACIAEELVLRDREVFKEVEPRDRLNVFN